MRKIFKEGDEVSFKIKNPNWKKTFTTKGRVKKVSEIFGGLVYIEAGSIIQDELVIKIKSVNLSKK